MKKGKPVEAEKEKKWENATTNWKQRNIGQKRENKANHKKQRRVRASLSTKYQLFCAPQCQACVIWCRQKQGFPRRDSARQEVKLWNPAWVSRDFTHGVLEGNTFSRVRAHAWRPFLKEMQQSICPSSNGDLRGRRVVQRKRWSRKRKAMWTCETLCEAKKRMKRNKKQRINAGKAWKKHARLQTYSLKQERRETLGQRFDERQWRWRKKRQTRMKRVKIRKERKWMGTWPFSDFLTIMSRRGRRRRARSLNTFSLCSRGLDNDLCLQQQQKRKNKRTETKEKQQTKAENSPPSSEFDRFLRSFNIRTTHTQHEQAVRITGFAFLDEMPGPVDQSERKFCCSFFRLCFPLCSSSFCLFGLFLHLLLLAKVHEQQGLFGKGFLKH